MAHTLSNIKCECGHANPVGTVLCESCGKPLNEDDKQKTPLEMRYEGMARRSQTFNKAFIDKVWNFFSSVKVAIWLIILSLTASAVGTIFPQEQYIPVPKPAEIYYEQAYGLPGKIFYLLGFHNLYSSWWFVLLLMMIGTSLVICSLDRVIPLYRALKKQRAKRHKSFLQRQRITTVYTLDERSDREELLNRLEKGLQAKRFRMQREGSSLMGEKGRISRWGPYVNHIGLIIFLIGVLMRLLPGFYLDEYVWVREGEIKKVPETNYYVKNEAFEVELYDKDDYVQKPDENQGPIVKNYQTNAILYINKNAGVPGAEPDLVEVKRHAIRVNYPLEYKELLLYQAGQQTNLLKALNLTLTDRKTGKELGDFQVDLFDPKQNYSVSKQIDVKVLEYYPDLVWEENKPVTQSSEPNNPGFVVEITGPKSPKGEKQWVFLGRTLAANKNKQAYNITFQMPELVDRSGLMVRKDKSLPVIYFGSFIVMVGLVMGFYWQHRRIWFQMDDAGKLYIAAHTNKNWYGMKKDVQSVLEVAHIDLPEAELDKGGKST